MNIVNTHDTNNYCYQIKQTANVRTLFETLARNVYFLISTRDCSSKMSLCSHDRCIRIIMSWMTTQQNMSVFSVSQQLQLSFFTKTSQQQSIHYKQVENVIIQNETRARVEI